jgi:hypothetical protein
MSDPISAAKSAREALARALGAIQSDPSVPPQVMAIAEPVSNAMGALFQIERSGGAATATSGPIALESVRRALGLLQQQPTNHPAVQVALEAVAGSLGLVHGLASSKPAAAGPPRPQQPAPYAQPTQPQAAFPQQQPYPSQQQPGYGAPAPAYPQPGGAPAQYQPPPAGSAYGGPPVQSPQAYAATYVAPSPPVAQQVYPPPAQPYQPPAAKAPAAPQPAAAGGAVRVEAELGAHSPSNFYKGLSGNDVVDHGGLFIATYNIPRIGQPISVHVSMPGGYEFDAQAVVKWTRDTVDSSHGQNAPPGFGAQFTQITPEARQLVYRYVRNREPLFHDDL